MIKLLFKDLPLVSTNDMYVPTKGKNKGAFLRKSSQLIEFQALMETKLLDITNTLDPKSLYEFRLKISLPEFEYYTNNRSRLRANDASNYVKAIEDSVTSILGYNDTNNIRLKVEKGYNKKNKWMVGVAIEEIDEIDNLLEFNEEEYDYVYE